MLYHLLYPLADEFSALNVFRYLTFRGGGAIMTPAAPFSITPWASARMAANPGAETPTTTGSELI